VLLAIVLAPIPYTLFAPSAPRPIGELIVVDGATRELSGQLLASSAGFRKATAGLALWALVDSSRDIKRLPDGKVQKQVTLTALELDLSVMAAAVIGLDLAGRDASVTSDGLRVLAVASADAVVAVLRPGDLLLEAAGEPLVLPSDLAGLAAASSAGEVIPMLRRRDGRDEVVDVPVHVIPDRKRIEALTVPINPVLHLPDGVSVTGIELEAVGGSAGLMLALAIHDRFADRPLLAGRTVTGTGSIDRAGNVFPIQGIRQKVIAAEAAGVDLFLAPADQYEEALGAADHMPVLSIATVAEAIEVLRGSAVGG